MLLQSLRALCKAPDGAGSIWKYLEALVRATAGFGKIACGFWTDLYLADQEEDFSTGKGQKCRELEVF